MPLPFATMTYGLASDVHMAEVDGDLVLLDARRNRYFCIARESAAEVAPALRIRSRYRPSAPLLDELEAAGLFDYSEAGLPVPAASRAVRDIHGVADMPDPLHVADRLRIARAWAWATAMLHVAPPRAWFERAAARHADPRYREDSDLVLRLARRSLRCQPWLPDMGRCLPNSLFLLELLHLYRLRATWIFGVRTYPFEAHCWLELDGMVLNDTIEHVRWFTPIAAI